MTTIQTLPKANTSSTGDKPALHTFCNTCFPVAQPGNIALCGYRSKMDHAFRGTPPADFPLCVVCEDLLPAGCPKCGAGR